MSVQDGLEIKNGIVRRRPFHWLDLDVGEETNAWLPSLQVLFVRNDLLRNVSSLAHHFFHGRAIMIVDYSSDEVSVFHCVHFGNRCFQKLAVPKLINSVPSFSFRNSLFPSNIIEIFLSLPDFHSYEKSCYQVLSKSSFCLFE